MQQRHRTVYAVISDFTFGKQLDYTFSKQHICSSATQDARTTVMHTRSRSKVLATSSTASSIACRTHPLWSARENSLLTLNALTSFSTKATKAPPCRIHRRMGRNALASPTTPSKIANDQIPAYRQSALFTVSTADYGASSYILCGCTTCPQWSVLPIKSTDSGEKKNTLIQFLLQDRPLYHPNEKGTQPPSLNSECF